MEPVNAFALATATFLTGLFLGWWIKRDSEGKIDFLIDNALLTKEKLDNMPTKEEFKQALTEVNDALSNIGDDITRLTESLQTGNLDEAGEQEVFSELIALGQRAKEIAGRTAEPDAPVE